MSALETSKHTARAPQDLIHSYLFRALRNASELVHADGGTISATDVESGETYDFSYGSSYRPPSEASDRPVARRHIRVDLSGSRKVWSPSLPFRTAKVHGAVWLYRQGSATKPADFTDDDRRSVRVFMDMAALGLEQAMEVVRLREVLHWAGINTVKAMIHAIHAKDPYTSEHCQRVADVSTRLAENLGYDNIRQVWAAASVHDVGKIGLLDTILEKAGQLRVSEMETVREHPIWGGEIVKPFTDEWDLVPGVRCHHEWIDGRGYPDGLAGEEIPLVGRIITIADAYDAMTTDRPYRRAMDRSAALDRLAASAGIQFDPQIVAVARDCLN